MRGARRAHDRDVSELEPSDPMRDRNPHLRVTLLDLRHALLHLRDGHARVRLVLEQGHRMPVGVIAHGPEEHHDGSGPRPRDRRAHRVDVDRPIHQRDPLTRRAHEVSRAPAALLEQLDPFDPRQAIEPLDHVVRRERPDRSPRHRLHLDACPPDALRANDDFDHAVRVHLHIGGEVGEG